MLPPRPLPHRPRARRPPHPPAHDRRQSHVAPRRRAPRGRRGQAGTGGRAMKHPWPTVRTYLGYATFASEYDAALVEGFKAVPVAYRSYDPETRIWTVSTPYVDRVLDRFLR